MGCSTANQGGKKKPRPSHRLGRSARKPAGSRKHDGNEHQEKVLKSNAREVKISRLAQDMSRPWSYDDVRREMKHPGDVIVFKTAGLDVPFPFGGEKKIVWRVGKRILTVNGRVFGVNLTDLSPQQANLLIRKQGKNIRVVIWAKATTLHPTVISALNASASDRLYLNLQEYGGRSKELKRLEPLAQKLVYLSLKKSFVNDRYLKNLTMLFRLETLVLHRTHVTQKGIKHLVGLPRLKHLDLSFSKVAQGTLALLCKLSNLETLSLSDTSITKETLRPLGGLKKLRSLHLAARTIGDEDLLHLSQLSRLEELSFSASKITPKGLVLLARLAHLRRLAHLSRLPNLHALTLIRTQITDGGLKQLYGLQDAAQNVNKNWLL